MGQRDRVMTPSGKGATVLCVTRWATGGSATMVFLKNSLILTPYHPVRIDGVWKFPSDLEATHQIDCDYVYNYVLDTDRMD